MHHTIQTILMVRDKDIRRWARPTAILMFCLAIVCLVGAVMVPHMVDRKIAPVLREVTAKEVKILERHSTSDNSGAFSRMISMRRKVDEGILGVASASVWLLAGVGLIALSHGIMSWRAYDLVSSERTESLTPSDGNKIAEQAAT